MMTVAMYITLLPSVCIYTAWWWSKSTKTSSLPKKMNAY